MNLGMIFFYEFYSESLWGFVSVSAIPQTAVVSLYGSFFIYNEAVYVLIVVYTFVGGEAGPTLCVLHFISGKLSMREGGHNRAFFFFAELHCVMCQAYARYSSLAVWAPQSELILLRFSFCSK